MMFYPFKNTGFFPVSKNLAPRQVSLRWGGALVLHLCASFIVGGLPVSPRRVKRDFMIGEFCGFTGISGSQLSDSPLLSVFGTPA